MGVRADVPLARRLQWVFELKGGHDVLEKGSMMSSSSVIRPWRVVIAVGLVAAGLVVSDASPASGVTCESVPTPSVGSGSSQLNGVAITSSRNAWAVGSYFPNFTHSQPLIERWNGTAWLVQASPNPSGSDLRRLSGVAATSSRNAWTVGSYHGSQFPKALLEHWNGSAWKIQASPKLRFWKLFGVAATSSANAWAVGYDRHGALIEHWNGRAWAVQASPELRTGELMAVTATSSRNAWAVGYHHVDAGDLTVSRPLVEHWNGMAWKVQKTPNARSFTSLNVQLSGVAATSPSNAWAVGYGINGFTADPVTLTLPVVEHWNGRAWRIQKSPTAGGDIQTNRLLGVAAVSSTNAWAVGPPINGATIEHWNGTSWRLQPSPGAPNDTGWLLGVAAKSATNLWAVGTTGDPTELVGQTLAVHCA